MPTTDRGRYSQFELTDESSSSMVVAPGFLTVQPMPTTNTTFFGVPQLDFNTSNFVTNTRNDYLRSGDSKIYKLAIRTSVTRQPMLLESTFANETYHLDFAGPAVKWMSANESVVNNLTIDIGTGLFARGRGPIDFLSWVGDDEPVQVLRENVTAVLDTNSTDGARLFVMTNTGNWSETITATLRGVPYHHRKVNVTECLLYNATYSVNFDFGFPTFGKMLVGSSTGLLYGAERTYLTSARVLDIDWSSGEAVARDLQQMFQNITLSLLSDDRLVHNSTTADLVPVNVTSWPIIYVYHQTELFITYGLALLSALGCSIIGLYAFSANRKSSYQNTFSTFLRATDKMHVRSKVKGSDVGADPLPKRLGKSDVEFPHRL
ncbi:hypothetical protein Q7P36_009520 [Cladosporium allicinum]